MAQIRPFRGWRYAEQFSTQMEELTSPLFDVVSEDYRDFLYANPYNSIHLSVPMESESAKAAAERFQKWVTEKIVLQDDQPSIYPYVQEFSLSGSARIYRRKGFICFIKAYDWTENMIFRHENTIPQAVNGRIEMLQETELNISPTHGLYHDPEFVLEVYLDEAIQNPIYEVEDYQGVVNKLGRITEPKIIEKFVRHLARKEVILADGHHRYEASLVHRREQNENNPQATGEELYQFHQMYLTNSASDDLRILPTHRLISGLPQPDPEQLLACLSEFFTVKRLATPYDIEEIIRGKKWAFGLILPTGAYKLRLKSEVHSQIHWKFPQVVKDLDLTVMHYFVIAKGLGIQGREHRTSPNIQFERNFSVCLERVRHGKANLALITNEIQMEEVRAVCKSGETMPQKSTYFYPKALCGLVFGSITEV